MPKWEEVKKNIKSLSDEEKAKIDELVKKLADAKRAGLSTEDIEKEIDNYFRR